MCGRYTLKTLPSAWNDFLFPQLLKAPILADFQPRYNIAPTQMVLSLSTPLDKQGESDEPEFSYFRWGLIPPWSNDAAIGSRMINARSETLLEKRSFQGPMKSRRCLVLADGYYEWQKIEAAKRPIWFSPSDGGLLFLAGIWEVNKRVKKLPVHSCSVITTSASPDIEHIHDRMPAILYGEAAKAWLDPKCSDKEAQQMLGPLEPSSLKYHAVSPIVNSPHNDVPECLELSIDQ